MAILPRLSGEEGSNPGSGTETDALLEQAKELKEVFDGAAQTEGFAGAVFAAPASLADLCVRIVENQQRLERELEKMNPRWRGPGVLPGG